MSQPQQSLRKHRQTLVGQPQPRKKSYGDLNASDSLAVPEVGLRDKQKIGDLVKRRFSSRPTFDPLNSPIDAVPALPSNAVDLISSASIEDTATAQPVTSATATPRPRQESIVQTGEVTSPNISRGDRRRPSGPAPMPQQTVTMDFNAFLKDDFDPKVFISQQLSNSTDVEISKFADKLTNIQIRLNQERKDSMYKNYKTFLKVGGSIVMLGNELETLGKALSELHTTTSAIKEDAEQFIQTSETTNSTPNIREPTLSLPSLNNNNSNNNNSISRPGVVMSRSNSQRHSVQMLEDQWAKEMSNLFRVIDGASKYLPVIPGRHILRESAGWYQLNFVTWKPLQPIHLVLLNDYLLISTKQRRSERSGSTAGHHGAPQKKLVALQCWSLLEIELSDLSQQTSRKGQQSSQQPPSSQLTKQAISVKTGSVSYVYRSERPESHRMILNEFKKAKAELQRQRNFSPRLDSPRSFTPVESIRSPTPEARRTASLHSRNGSLSLASATQAFREAEQFVQEIDSKIAYQHFEDAVELIESKKTYISDSVDMASRLATRRQSTTLSTATSGPPSQILRDKIDQRSNKLANILLNELSQDYMSKAQILNLMEMLTKLKYSDQAKKVFLESRHNQLQSRIKQIDFQGDIVAYISQVAIIYFQIIKSTIEMFRSCFSEPQLSSSLVEWSKRELDNYILQFARQLYNVKANTSIYKNCVQITKQESDHLKSVGLDLGFMLDYIYEAIDKADSSDNS